MDEVSDSGEEPGGGVLGRLGSWWRSKADAAPASKWGMAIDLDLCDGCGDCVGACRDENELPAGESWMRTLQAPTDDGSGEFVTVPVPCLHCERPACIESCPTGAARLTAEGLSSLDEDLCTACGACVEACPYSARSLGMSACGSEVSLKCTFCEHRLREAQEIARTEGGSLSDRVLQRLPACAETCHSAAITFGDLADPESAVSLLHRDPRAHRLLDDLGTRPKVVHLARTR